MDEPKTPTVRYYRNRCIERFTAGVPGVHPGQQGIPQLIDRYLAYACKTVEAEGVIFQHNTTPAVPRMPWVMVYPGGGWTQKQLIRWLHRTVQPFRRWVCSDPDYCELFRWDGKLRVIDGGKRVHMPIQREQLQL